MKNLIKRARRAFTIVELVIVIAVIAILAAVLIPTFVSVINSANESSDVQAVKNMNTALIADEAINGKPSTVSEAMEVIEASGLNPNGYQALISGRAIYYSLYREGSSGINRMLYVDLDDNGNITDVIYPSEYKLSDLAGSLYNMYGREIVDSTWMYKTESTIASTSLSNYVKESNGTVRYETGWENALLSKDEDGNLVNTAIYDGSTLVGAAVVDRSGMAAVSEYIESLTDAGKNFTVLVANDIDMNGVEWKPITEFSGSFYGGNKTISNFVISDATADSLSFAAASANSNYSFYGFISVFSGTYFGDITLTVDIDEPGNGAYTATGYNTNNHTTAGAIGGIVLPSTEYSSSYTCTVANVTVNGTITGTNRVAGIVGFVGGYSTNVMAAKVEITNCTNNATLISSNKSGGTYGTAGGIVSIINQWDSSITISNCKNTGNLTGVWVGGILADSWRSNSTTSCDTASAAYSSTTPASLTISNCENSGTLTASIASTDTTYQIAVGGIMGVFNGVSGKTESGVTTYNNIMSVSINNCKNEGDIAVSWNKTVTDNSYIFVGEILALDKVVYSQQGGSAVTTTSDDYLSIVGVTLSNNTASSKLTAGVTTYTSSSSGGYSINSNKNLYYCVCTLGQLIKN